MSASTYRILLESSASSLSLNPEFSQVVIAGSHIFKIFSIDDGELTEKLNLYAAKSLNPYFSSSDVVWNPLEDSKLATVARNGAVVTWDLKKSTRSKLDQVFKDHERPVNKVNFHPQESHLLISGSLDGHMKLFDTRGKEAVTTFIGNAGSVRDIQFCPHNGISFAAGTENGTVQLWDMRRTDKTERQFTGHRGPVYALDWHPEERSWIATACRDNEIKVWDLDDKTSTYKSIIRTVASVGRVKWRPKNKHHLASCALVKDCSISVWDIRRPFIPFAAFYEHKDVTTGIAWQGNSQILLSVGKDNTLYHHSFIDASHPVDSINPNALAISPLGVLSFAKPSLDVKMASKSVQQKRSALHLGPVLSTMSIVATDDVNSPLSVSYLIECAKQFKVEGRSLHDLCEHNANVAKKLNKLEFAVTWQMLQVMYGGASSSGPSSDHLTPFLNKEDPRNDGTSYDGDLKPSRHLSGETVGENHFVSGEEQESETDDDAKLVDIASGDAIAHDFFFGDDDLSNNFEFDPVNAGMFDRPDSLGLPSEAFQPRTDVMFESTTPPDDFATAPPTSKEDLQLSEELGPNSDFVMSGSLQLVDCGLNTTPLDVSPIVVESLHYYANRGEIQMTVSIYIVVREHLNKNSIDDSVLEHWFLSYIDLLHRFRLWNIATIIMKNANGIPAVEEMNQQSTCYRIVCGSCDQAINNPRAPCRKKCETGAASRCALCQCVVRGLFVWCQGCSHGGHLNHIMEWMEENPSCPAGCGHFCQYT